MVSDNEIIEWGKEKYPQYIENVELLRSLYNRQVLGKNITFQKRIKMIRLNDIEKEKKGKIKAVVVEIRRSGVKNKKWYSLILGDSSGMKKAMVFMDKEDDDLIEGMEYIFILSYREDKGIAGEVYKRIDDKNESLGIDAIYEYVYELNNGVVNKEKFMMFVSKRGLKYEDVMDLFGFIDDGDVIKC